MITTHPLWRPYHRPSAEEIAQARVQTPAAEVIEVVGYDPSWSSAYDILRGRIVQALGDAVMSVEHVGSTSVRGLAAKPVIDIDLTVADSGDEATWLRALEDLGMELTVREPEWEQHRCLRARDPRGNVHVWSPGSIEARRHVAFRDWLRAHPSDRDDYARTKRAVAAEGHTDVMAYNNAKGAMIYDLYERIFTADPEHLHEGVRRG
ncbi:GrpB family protein [Nocardioides salsibiostraticola]